MQACILFLATGVCPTTRCAKPHVRVCTDCEVISQSNETFAEHMNGKQHRFRTGAGGRSVDHPIWCEPCNKPLKGTRQAYQYHLQTSQHRKAVEDFVEPGAGAQEPSQYCELCKVHVKQQKWSHHRHSARHTRKADFAVYRAAIAEAEAEQNSNNIVVEPHVVDFGIVEADGLDDTTEFRTTFTINVKPSSDPRTADAPDSAFTIVSLQLDSQSFRKRKRRPYAANLVVDQAETSKSLDFLSPRTVGITFSPRGRRGRYYDRLWIILKNVATAEVFRIDRKVKAIVTTGEDYHLLKATEKFIPRKREPEVEPSRIVRGPNSPALGSIVWKYRLTLARMPTVLRKILQTTSGFSLLKQQDELFKAGVIPDGPLAAQTYGPKFQSLLFIEEYRLSSDLQQFNMRGRELKQVGDRFVLHVPGLAEGRPSVIVGDRIIVRAAGSRDEKWFEGCVFAVRLETVELKFAKSFGNDATLPSANAFDVHFLLNRLPLRRMHQVLEKKDLPERILFPGHEHIKRVFSHAHMADLVRLLRPGNRRIAENPPQREAIANILHLQPGSAPFVVFGPPGTGKTVTIVEAMRQLTLKYPSAKILASAPSNSAADLLAERLVGEGMNATQLFRLNAPSRSKEQLPKKLLPFSLLNDQGTFAIPPLEVLSSYTVVVSTCLTAAVPYNLGLPVGHFSYIFVDEVGQAMEPEALIAVLTIGDEATNLIISGDPKQLGPVVRSPIAEKLGLGKSYLDRIMDHSAYDDLWRGVSWVKLLKNWRSHEGILRYPNDAFYRSELEACADPVITHSLLGFQSLPNPEFPVIFHGIVGEDDQEAQSPSYFNPDEASLVRKYLAELLEDRRLRLKDSDIGIIAPYSAQCVKIRQLIRKNFPAVNIKVGSVEEFQGQERRVIIISAVRSRPELVDHDVQKALGFVKNPRRFNVAVTRAQALLIVVGNPDILELDEHWKGFMSHVYLQGGWTGHEPGWDPRHPTDEFELGELVAAAIDEAEAGPLSTDAAPPQDVAGAENTQAYLDERAVDTSWRDAT